MIIDASLNLSRNEETCAIFLGGSWCGVMRGERMLRRNGTSSLNRWSPFFAPTSNGAMLSFIHFSALSEVLNSVQYQHLMISTQSARSERGLVDGDELSRGIGRSSSHLRLNEWSSSEMTSGRLRGVASCA